jgi:hypothetical protein
MSSGVTATTRTFLFFTTSRLPTAIVARKHYQPCKAQNRSLKLCQALLLMRSQLRKLFSLNISRTAS